MHEMALCRNVADIVLEEASRANAVRVSGIYLTIGYGRDIVEDLFETMLAWDAPRHHSGRGEAAPHPRPLHGPMR